MTHFRTTVRIWRMMLGLCWRRSRLQFSLLILVTVLATVSTALTGLGVRSIVAGSLHGSTGQVWIGAFEAALAYATSLVTQDLSTSMRTVLGSLVAYEDVEYRDWRASVELEGIEHLERSEHLDRLSLLHWNAGSWIVVNSCFDALDAASTVLRAVLVLVLLGTVNPVLLLIPVLAVVPLTLSARGAAGVNRAWRSNGPQFRTQQRYFALATGAGSGKELRVAGVGAEVVRRQLLAAEEAEAILNRARWRQMLLDAAGWSLFALGFVGALTLIVHGAVGNPARLGDVVLTVVVGLQLRAVIQAAAQRGAQVGERGANLEAFSWLHERFAAEQKSLPENRTPAPARLESGITFDSVSFNYPGKTEADKKALDSVSFHLPAGSVVAVVGEYGSGKTTIVKLLTCMYRPDSGRILLDGTDLASIDTPSWRRRISAAFQDFGRYRTTVAENIGIGDWSPEADGSFLEETGLTDAVAQADAAGLVSKLPQGLDTRLGRSFGGVELSEGQWQKLALARASRRVSPLLCVLDEPTASLDAPSEYVVFERYMQRARRIAQDCGGITVVVTHRFSTVAGADKILCVADGRIVEEGTHEELLTADGRYAALYRLQAEAYVGSA